MDLTLQARLWQVFPKIWCRESSAFPELWSPRLPATGQCLATAIIVSRCLGGDILHTVVNNKHAHFINQLPNMEEIDYTKSQIIFGSVGKRRCLFRQQHIAELEVAFPDIRKRNRVLASKFTTVTGIIL